MKTILLSMFLLSCITFSQAQNAIPTDSPAALTEHSQEEEVVEEILWEDEWIDEEIFETRDLPQVEDISEAVEDSDLLEEDYSWIPDTDFGQNEPDGGDLFPTIEALNHMDLGAVGPGTLSKNGLRYYIPIADETLNGQENLYVMERASPEEPFSKPQLLKGDFSKALLRNHQPSLTADECIMVFVSSESDTWGANQLFIATRKSINEPFENVRALDEINTDGETDAYPWISPDGLDLYMTKSLAGKDWLFHSKRNSLEEEFSGPEPLAIDYSGRILSASLTCDQQNLIICQSSDVYISRLNTETGVFGTPELIFNPGGGFFSAPIFSADGKELYMYNSAGSKKILCFKHNTASVRFASQCESGEPIAEISEVSEISEVPNLELLESIEFVPAEVYELPEAVSPNVMEAMVEQESTTQSEVETLVLHNAPTTEESWEAEVSAPRLIESIFPNPSPGRVNIRLNLRAEESLVLKVFNLEGRLVGQEHFVSAGNLIQSDQSQLAAGTYFYQVVQGEEESALFKVVISH